MAWYDGIVKAFRNDSLVVDESVQRIELQDGDPQKVRIVDTPEGRVPISAGRSSEPEAGWGFGVYDGSVVEPAFHIELLAALENLAKYNPDISFALDNIVQLGNTKFDIYFSDNISDKVATQMRQEISRVEKLWYSNTGGMMSLRNDLFTQVVLTGAISAERVPTNNLDGIGKVVLVNPKTVRFIYDAQEDSYKPYQIATRIAPKQNAVQGMNPLNPITYKYLALRKFNESPYAIPPFLSAMENVGIEKDMMGNFKTIIRKLGVMGFVNVLVKMPIRVMTDSDDEYARKLNKYLLDVATEVDKGVKKGFVVGYKEQHEFDVKPVNQNVAGVETLFKLNDLKKMAGLKQDPLMLGRNYSTTETVGRVILAKMGAQIENYQALIDMFLADTIHLHLLLQGYPVQYVQVESKKSLVGDEMREQDVYTKKIANAQALYQMGIISQNEVANIVGYDKPDQEEPRDMVNITMPDGSGATPPDAADPGSTNYKLYLIEKRLGKSQYEFHYGDKHEDCSCGCEKKHSLEELASAADFDKVVRQYAKSIGVTYKKAVDKITVGVVKGLSQLGSGTPIEQIVDNVLLNTFVGFEKNFSGPVKSVVEGWIGGIYKFYREQTSIFGKNFQPPKVKFNLKDYRTIEYYKKSDSLYLGKFITDESTKNSVRDFIKQTYLEDGVPIGRDPQNVAAFRNQFAEVLQGEDWKIARIVNTTVNKMRNTAAINYMDQAEVETFEIVGVPDRLQCDYCAAMDGKQFSVARALSHIAKVEDADPDMVPAISPFLSSSDMDEDEIDNMPAEDLEDRLDGDTFPPYHPSCRDMVVAVL